MCFSASASFTACAILGAAGFASVKKIQTPSQLIFAGIPLVFAIQQFAEGFVWLSLAKTGSSSHSVPIYVFLIFAQVIWPVWVPLSILLLEKNQGRRTLLKGLLVLGIMLSLYLAYCLRIYNVKASLTLHHVHYDLDYPSQYIPTLGIFYFLPTILPPFVSGQRRMNLLGSFNLLSFIITKLFFEDYVISVWCFFAALISVVVFFVIKDVTESEKDEVPGYN